MKKPDDLFKLIKSLEKAEKGYFKKFAQTHNKGAEQLYLKLFDAIDQQLEYNEPDLLKKFKSESFVKQLSVAKSYLWDLILKSQRAYRAQTSKFMRLNALMENGEILFEKGLYEQALVTWDKAKTLAEAYDEKAFILDIEAWKRRYFVDLKSELWDTNVLPSFETSDKLLSQYKTTFEIQKLYYQITKYIKTYPDFRNPEHKQKYEALLQDPLLQAENEPVDFYGRLYFNYVHSNYHNLTNNESENLKYINKVIDLWNNNPLLINVEPIRYIAAINNYLSALSKFGRYDEFINYVETFVPPSFNSISQEAIYYEHWWRWKEITFKLSKKDEEFGEFIEASYPKLIAFAPYINSVRWMLIRFAIAAYYFKTKKYNAALTIVNELIDAKDIELRKDIQAHTRMMYLILHFELKNTLILESITRSVKRYLQQNENYFATEKVFIKQFNKLIYAANHSEADKIINDLRSEVVEIFDTQRGEKIAFTYMPLAYWLNINL